MHLAGFRVVRTILSSLHWALNQRSKRSLATSTCVGLRLVIPAQSPLRPSLARSQRWRRYRQWRFAPYRSRPWSVAAFSNFEISNKHLHERPQIVVGTKADLVKQRSIAYEGAKVPFRPLN